MRAAACFRCDWEGEAEGSACPRCGATLVVAGAPEARRPAAVARPATPRQPSALLPDIEPEPPEPPALPPPPPSRGRSVLGGRRGVAAFAAVALLLGLVWWRDSAHRTGSLAGSHLTGRLVFAAFDRGGANERLYVVDLATGKVSLGPLIRPVTDLVASGAGTGWLGAMAGGYAYVLRGESPRQAPRLVGVGDVLAWGPGADSLVQEIRGRSPNPDCPLSIVSETDVRTGRAEVLYGQPECSGVLSVGADQASAVYLTLSAPQGAAVYLVGVERLHLLLKGYAMLSVSPVGDMIVVPEVELLGREPIPSAGAALFWQGKGGPLRIASDGRHLDVERVLAWAADGSFAVAVGTLGGIRSLWAIRAGVGQGERVPARIGPVLSPAPVLPGSRAAVPAASVASDGSVYFSAAGRLYVWRRGERVEIHLPRGTPQPAGPLAWLPAAG